MMMPYSGQTSAVSAGAAGARREFAMKGNEVQRAEIC
jgi:hypothetical protein